MLKRTYNKQTRIRKIITGITGILFLFYVVSCGSEEDTSSPSPDNADSTPPSAVENLKVDSFTDTQVVISWTAPTNTGTIDGTTPATLSNYVVKYKRTADSEFTEIDETGGGVRLATSLTGTSTTATVIGLSDNTSYTFLVVAVHSGNAVGLDAEAPTVEQTTLLREPTPPSAVRDLKVDSFTDTQVVFSWTAPANTGTIDGTTPATLSGYVVKYKRTADSEFTEIDETGEGVRLAIALTGTSTTATVTGLDANTSYTFLVVAVHSGDVVGLDAEAPTVEQTTAPAPPGNLRKINTCDKTTSVDLAWETSPGATSYKLYRGDTEIDSILTNTYTDTGLTGGTAYTYKVQSCSTAGCSGDSDPLTITTFSDKSFESIIEIGRTPADLTGYDQRSREIFSLYSRDVPVVAKYLKPGGSGDGSSFTDAEGNLKDVLDGITDATADNVYAVFLTGGNYQAGSSIEMKNHVAIIGGVDECLGSSNTVTALDGDSSYRVFNNSGLNSTALLYEVTVTNGGAVVEGGGMYNTGSSPSLVGVTFSGNTAGSFGGGMYNTGSSPSLVGVTFFENRANNQGGGMHNENSSPSLVEVTFSGNRANDYGGGIYNGSSSPSLVGVTFSSNTASSGGGMYNYYSSPTNLVRVTFSENTATSAGGGMYNTGSSPSLEEATFSENKAGSFGGGMANISSSSPSLVGVTFSGNSATGSVGTGGGIYNSSSSPILERVTFSENTAGREGGGMYNDNSSPILDRVTFSENTATIGGGMHNWTSSPSLVGVTFSGNHATNYGGGMYNDNDGKAGPRIINGIFWGNTASVDGPQFYFENYNNAQENLRIYNSLVEGGVGTLVSGAANTNLNQGGFVAGGGFVSSVRTDPVVISFSNIIATDPGLGDLADNGGSVWTHAITSTSPAVNQGLYVRRKDNIFYYSEDSTSWYINPDLSGKAAIVPTDAVDVTATDATGHTRTDRPDLGAYEAR